MMLLVHMQLLFRKLTIIEQQVDDLFISRIPVPAYHHAMQTGVAIDALGIDVDLWTDPKQFTHHLNIFILNSYVKRRATFLILKVKLFFEQLLGHLPNVSNIIGPCSLKDELLYWSQLRQMHALFHIRIDPRSLLVLAQFTLRRQAVRAFEANAGKAVLCVGLEYSHVLI